MEEIKSITRKKVLVVQSEETVVEHRTLEFDEKMWNEFIGDWEVETEANYEQAIQAYQNWNDNISCTYLCYDGSRASTSLVELMQDFINEKLWNEVEVDEVDTVESDVWSDIETQEITDFGGGHTIKRTVYIN